MFTFEIKLIILLIICLNWQGSNDPKAKFLAAYIAIPHQYQVFVSVWFQIYDLVKYSWFYIN